VEAIPYGMRWICRTIGTLFLERFGGEEREEDGEEPSAGKTSHSHGHSNGSHTSPAAAADGSIAANGGDSIALPPSSSSSSSSSLHRQVQSLQGGYVYLRFLNPAIVAPDGMNLIKAKPSKTVRRNLVLVAKVLQNLSNGVLFGGKEKYMQALNTFIESKRPAMERFFAALCAVEDVDEALSIERYTHSNLTSLSGSGSGSGSGTITIQLNQIYAMHQLLLQHKQQICLTRNQPAIYTANDPLAILLTKLGPNVPAPVPRAENASVTLRLEQTRSTRLSTVSGPPPPGGSSGGASSELVVHDPFGRGGTCASATEANPLYQQAKALLLSVLSRLPTDEGSSSSSQEKLHAHSLLGFLTAHKSAALLQGNEALSDSLANVISMLNTLFSMKLLLPSSGSGASEAREAAFNAFLHAAAQEALARQKEQAWLAKQSALVTAALHTVTKHHDYLQGRLDVYRTYLQNVRQGQAQQAAASAGAGKGGAKALGSSSSSSKSSAATAAAVAGPPAFTKTLKYSHADLLSMQLLASVDAEIPAKVLKALQYSIEMVVPATAAVNNGISGIGAATKATPRFFLSVVLKKGLTIPLLASPVEIVLEDLLALQEHATPTMTVESVQLNVNILVHLLNTQFIAAIPKR
jgi:Ras GTPase-activating-like protein IQGAP2/3